MRTILLLGLLLLLPTLSYAGFFVCGDDQDTVDGGLRTVHPSKDASQVEPDCLRVAPGDIAAQRTFLQTTDRRFVRLDTTANVAVLKSQSVIDQIVAAEAAADAVLAAIQAELQSAGCASTSLADAEQKISNQLQAARDATDLVSNIATAKTALTTTIDKTELLLKSVARCFFALRGVILR